MRGQIVSTRVYWTTLSLIVNVRKNTREMILNQGGSQYEQARPRQQSDAMTLPSEDWMTYLIYVIWGPFLDSPDIFSGPESYFMCAMFTLKTQILLVLKAEQ